MWAVYAFLSAGCAALVAIVGKLGLKNLDSTLATTVRSIIMALFLLIVRHKMIRKILAIFMISGYNGVVAKASKTNS